MLNIGHRFRGNHTLNHYSKNSMEPNINYVKIFQAWKMIDNFDFSGRRSRPWNFLQFSPRLGSDRGGKFAQTTFNRTFVYQLIPDNLPATSERWSIKRADVSIPGGGGALLDLIKNSFVAASSPRKQSTGDNFRRKISENLVSHL